MEQMSLTYMRETIIKLLESEVDEDKMMGRSYLLKYYPQLRERIIKGPWGGGQDIYYLNLTEIEPVLKHEFRKINDTTGTTWVGIIYGEKEL